MKKRKIFRRGLVSDKRGTDLIMPPILIFILSAVLVVGILAFIFKASTGAFVYEQAYAKQVALIIDGAKPEMQVRLDFSKGFEVAEKNEYRGKIVDIEDDKVVVKLRDKGGYSMRYFSDYSVDTYQDNQSKRVILNIGGNPIDYVPGKVVYDVSLEELNAALLYAKDKGIGDRVCECGDACEEYANFIYDYANEKEVGPLLVLSVMIQESKKCNPDYVNQGGDVGLMQINSGVHCGYWELPSKSDITKCRDKLKDPKTNIRVGTEILRSYYDSYGVPEKRASYESKVKEHCKNPSYQKMYLSHRGWNAALRAYNGFGCPSANVGYVEEVNKWFVSMQESGVSYVA